MRVPPPAPWQRRSSSRSLVPRAAVPSVMLTLVTVGADFGGYHLATRVLKCSDQVTGLDVQNQHCWAPQVEVWLAHVTPTPTRPSRTGRTRRTGQHRRGCLVTTARTASCVWRHPPGRGIRSRTRTCSLDRNLVDFHHFRMGFCHSGDEHRDSIASSSSYAGNVKLRCATGESVDQPLVQHASSRRRANWRYTRACIASGLLTSGVRIQTVHSTGADPTWPSSASRRSSSPKYGRRSSTTVVCGATAHATLRW